MGERTITLRKSPPAIYFFSQPAILMGLQNRLWTERARAFQMRKWPGQAHRQGSVSVTGGVPPAWGTWGMLSSANLPWAQDKRDPSRVIKKRSWGMRTYWCLKEGMDVAGQEGLPGIN